MKLTSLDPSHVIEKLLKIEFYMGQLLPGSPPVKAGQLVTTVSHGLIMQEVRSEKYAPYGITHGQGPLEWHTLTDMNYTTFNFGTI